MALSEDSLLRIKIIILINLAAIVGMFLNLLLYTLNAEVVMDDLIDAIIKVISTTDLNEIHFVECS